MNQELLFAKKIEEIRDLARLQGNMVTKEQVEEAFAEIGMDVSQLGPVYEYLNSKKIGVDEALKLEDTLSEDDKDYLSMYLEGIAEIPQYSDSEKTATYIAAMAGESDAKERLIEIMLPNVVDLAKLYTGQGVLIEDLIGEGNVALSMSVEMLGALESPEEVPETLVKMIMDAMEESINIEEENKKYDNKMADKVNKVAEAAMELATSMGRKVTVEELAEDSKLSKKTILDAIRISGKKIEDIEYSDTDEE